MQRQDAIACFQAHRDDLAALGVRRYFCLVLSLAIKPRSTAMWICWWSFRDLWGY